MCGEQIPLTDARSQVQHIERCYDDNAELLGDMSPVRRLSDWNEPPDPEWAKYNDDLRESGQDPEVQYARGRRSNVRRASEH